MNEITDEVHTGSGEMLKGSRATLAEIDGLLAITGDVRSAAENVVEKAKTVKQNADQSLTLLDRNTENMKSIDELAAFFKTRE